MWDFLQSDQRVNYQGSGRTKHQVRPSRRGGPYREILDLTARNHYGQAMDDGGPIMEVGKAQRMLRPQGVEIHAWSAAEGVAVEVSGGDQLPLARVPVEWPVKVRGARNTLSLSGGAGHQVTMAAANVRGVQVVDGRVALLRLEPMYEGDISVSGVIEVLEVGPGAKAQLQSSDTIGQVVLTGGSVTDASGDPVTVEISADDVPLKAGHYQQVTLRGAPTVQVGSTVEVTHLVAADGATPTLEGGAIDAEFVHGHVTVGAKSRLQVAEVTEECVLAGGGDVVVARSTLRGLTLNGPWLSSPPASSLSDVAGELRAKQCRNVSIRSRAGEPFLFAGIAGDDSLKDAALRGVLIVDDEHGPAHLAELAAAAVVEPDVTQLRVYQWGWHRPAGSWRYRWRRARTDAERHELDSAAFFAQELAALTDTKCGQGNLRTKASWAAYRGRNLTARSRLERWALHAYRTLGYGQRVGPPFAAWLAAAVVGAVVLMILSAGSATVVDGGTAGIAGAHWSYLGSLGRLLMSPFYLLRLAGDPELRALHTWRDGAAIVVQTLVTVPFVFVGIALSRLLRAEWPGPGR